jgi:hypothetical protein
MRDPSLPIDLPPEAFADGDGGDVPAPERPPRVVQLTMDLQQVTDEAIAALADDATIYQRDGRLARVVRVASTEKDAFALEGAPQIRELPTCTLRERLSELARWERFVPKRGWVRTLPRTDIVQQVEARGSWPTVRPIAGIIETPSLRPDGSLISTPGYDSATGFYLAPSCDYPAVPERPSQEQAADALAQLAEVWCDFPFASEPSRYVPIAAALTLILRPAIQGPTPAFVTDANVRGCGKTLAQDLACAIGSATPAPKCNFPTTPEELDKVLAGYAVRGASLVPFDNLDVPLAGASLDRCLSAWPTVELRPLGRTEIQSLRWNAVVMATGNNLEIRGDTTRRVLVARIESPEENPEERGGFRHPAVLAWVRAERARLVSAALTIARGYFAAGCPAQWLRPWGTYESWSALVPSAIAWAGGCRDVTEARAERAAAEDPGKAALRTILDCLPRLSAEPITVRAMVAALYPPERLRGGLCPPDGHDDLREALECLCPAKPGHAPDTNRLGHAMRKLRRRVIGGRRLDSFPIRNLMGWVVQGGPS